MSKANTPTRLAWVDYARGMAIMLVVYRHVVVGMKRAGIQVTNEMYNIQEIFHNFRMPVFFVLSGIFLSASLKRKQENKVIKDKVATLLYPYLLWGIITTLFQIYLSNYTNAKSDLSDLLSIVIQPRAVSHLWYLLALFTTSILYILLYKRIRNPWVHAAIAILLHYISQMDFIKNFSLFVDLFYFYPFLLAGTFISYIILDINKGRLFLNSKRLIWLLPVFLAGQWFWFVHKEMEKEYLLLFLVINLVACYFVYIISGVISRLSWTRFLAYIGRHSLYIYILHIYFAAFARNVFFHFTPGVSIWVLIFGCWIAAVIFPIITYQVLKKIGFERLFTLKQKTLV